MVGHIVRKRIDDRLKIVGLPDNTDHYERLPVNRYSETERICVVEKALRDFLINENDFSKIRIVLLHKRPPCADDISAGRKIMQIYAADTSHIQCILSALHTVQIASLHIERSVSGIRQTSDFLLLLIRDSGNAGRGAAVHIVFGFALHERYGHCVIARADQVLHNLVIRSLDCRHNRDNRRNTDDHTQHGEK